MSTSMDTAAATPVASAGSNSMNILSDKVQRALQVRTDTPAMKAALEALGQLDNGGGVVGVIGGTTSSSGGVGIASHSHGKQTSHNNSNSNNNTSSHLLSVTTTVTSLDARSVRHAIEYDALQQALLLQQNLSSLVTTIRELRQGISDCAALAHQVKQAISTNVVTETTRTSMISTSTSTTTSTTTTAAAADSGDVALTTSDQQQQQQQAEEKLAATIAEAFQRRNVARHRLEAVTQFLETFDLSEKDSRLLDHYNFEDMQMHHHNSSSSAINAGGSSDGNSLTASAAAPNGMAFLRALERVWQIRRALVKTFGGGGGGLSGGSGNNFMMESSFDGGEKSGGGGGGLGASSALRMMESLAQKQEHAYERLYHWLQSYLQLLGKTSLTHNNASEQQQQQCYDYGLMQLDQSLQHPFVQHALYTLRHVHAFYHHTVELLSGRRRQEETRLFLLALTTGIPQEQQPPLERLAHDPTQYVGEMLAHAFRAMSSEADVALTVIHYKPSKKQKSKATNTGSGGDASANGQEGGMEQHDGNDGMDDDDDEDDDDDDDDQNEDDQDGSTRSDDLDYNNNMTSFSGTTTLTDKSMTATQMLSVTMSGMSRPLRARVQQVIASLARRPNNNRNNSSSRNRNNNAGGDFQDGSVLEEVDSDDNMMMFGDDDDITFEDEGAIVRNKLTHLYEICGLLLFYISAMSKTVGKLQEADIKRIKRRQLKKKAKTARLVNDENPETNNDADDVLETSAVMDQEANALVVCLMECLEEAAKAYEASIRVYCAMLNQLSVTTGESQPNLVLAMMVRIAECRMSSPGFAQDVIGTNQACQTIISIEWVTETLVQAALMCCSNLDDAAAVKQAVATAKKADIDVIVAEKLDEQIEAVEASLINKLVETESANVLDLCGLGSLVAAWQRWKQRSATSSALIGAAGGDEDDDNTTTTLMASYPGLSAEDVEAGMKDFLASLYSPPLPSLESAIKDPLFRKRARVKIAENVCQTYAELYADITSVSKGGYEDVSFLGHTPDQVKRLFSA